jgi:hypothetical protein
MNTRKEGKREGKRGREKREGKEDKGKGTRGRGRGRGRRRNRIITYLGIDIDVNVCAQFLGESGLVVSGGQGNNLIRKRSLGPKFDLLFFLFFY